MNDFLIRPMLPADIPAVMVLEQAGHAYPWTEGIMRDNLASGYHCHVLERGGVILGFGVVQVAVGEAHLLNICIDRSRQGKGLGRELLVFLSEAARQAGADTMFLEVRPSNTRAVALYQGFGFNEIGLRRNYYPAPEGREDALMMALML